MKGAPGIHQSNSKPPSNDPNITPTAPQKLHAPMVAPVIFDSYVELWLGAGATHTLALAFQDSTRLTGRILRAGQGVSGAIVELHAADPLLALCTYLGIEPGFAGVFE